jgi:hypothetical protein
MTIQELTEMCEEKINNPTAGGVISLMIPGRAYGSTKKFPGLGIRGEIVCEYETSCLCAFDAKQLSAALEKARMK